MLGKYSKIQKLTEIRSPIPLHPDIISFLLFGGEENVGGNLLGACLEVGSNKNFTHNFWPTMLHGCQNKASL